METTINYTKQDDKKKTNIISLLYIFNENLWGKVGICTKSTKQKYLKFAKRNPF